jgi:hypothetical protein
MSVINAQVINHSQPAVSVGIDNGGSGSVVPVTYNQLRNSLGNHNYNVDNIYIYAQDYNQLSGSIYYNIFDGNGNVTNYSVISALDPYQNTTAINIDTTKMPVPVVFNGNSSVSAIIQANEYLQITFSTKRVTQSFGMNLINFADMNKLTNSNFFENYGSSIKDIMEYNKDLKNEQQLPDAQLSFNGANMGQVSFVKETKSKSKNIRFLATTLIIATLGVFLLKKK